MPLVPPVTNTLLPCSEVSMFKPSIQ